MKYQKLISIMDQKLYQLLFNSSNTEVYLTDFLNAYFHFHGENRIDRVIILESEEFIKKFDSDNRLFIYFIQANKKYYYEIKFSKKTNNEEYFDDTFILFTKYCFSKNKDGKPYLIGKIILNMKKKLEKTPIIHYSLQNKMLDSFSENLDIHILFLSTLKKILETKSYYELNLFERWILLLQANTIEEGRKICMKQDCMNLFLKSWIYNSKRLQYENLKSFKEEINFYLLEKKELEVKRKIAIRLLKAGCTISFVVQITDLSQEDILNLRRKLRKESRILDA